MMNNNKLYDILLSYNPWWTGDYNPTGITREPYLKKIIKFAETKEIIVLNGIRRSGKTTLLLHTIHRMIQQGKNPKSILFMNCDEPGVGDIYSLDDILETFQKEIYSGHDITIVFDEIQNVKGWERRIKTWYDRKTYSILLSGSTSSLLTSNLATLISGRYLKIPVYPLDFREYLLFKGFFIDNADEDGDSASKITTDKLTMRSKRFELLEHLRNYMNEGGFPAVVETRDERLKKELITGYYATIIFRDIEHAHEIRSPKTLHDLLQYYLSNMALPYSYNRIAKMLGTDAVTVKDYTSYAEEAYFLHELKTFSYSVRVQNASHKKIYVADTGLRNSVSFKFSDDTGRTAENLVYLSLKRLGVDPYFWKGKNEVDFVIHHEDSTMSAVNVCYADEIPERELKGLAEFYDEFRDNVRAQILITRDLEMEEDGVTYIPLYAWLLGKDKEILGAL